jgi:hypothetical protein
MSSTFINLTPQLAQGLGLAATNSISAMPLAMRFRVDQVQPVISEYLSDRSIADRLGEERINALQSMMSGEALLDEDVVHQHLNALIEARAVVRSLLPPISNRGGASLLQGADGNYYRFGEGPGIRNIQRVFIPNRGVAAMSAIRYLRAMEQKYGVKFEIAVPFVEEDLREPWIRMADLRVPIPRDSGDGPISCFKHPDQKNKKDIPRMVNAGI